jgi:hypothetical protein
MTQASLMERAALLVEQVRYRLRGPVIQREATLDLPELEARGTTLVSVERFRLEIDRAFYMAADMGVPLRSMLRGMKRVGHVRPLPRRLCHQFEREFADLARQFDVSGQRLSREFAQFHPADSRLVPLHAPLVAMIDADRLAGYYAGAALMYAARGDRVQIRQHRDRFREFWTRRNRADLAFCEIAEDLRSRYPELMENFALSEEWIADLRRNARKQSALNSIDEIIRTTLES